MVHIVGVANIKLELSLAPDGNLRLHLPTAHQRYLDIPDTTAGLATIKRILRNAQAYDPNRGPARGHIGAFPTQAVIEAWHKVDMQRRRDEAAAEAKAQDEESRAAYAAKGIDLSALEIKL